MDNTGSFVNGKPFNGVMSLPLELTLEKENGVYRIRSTLSEEIYEASDLIDIPYDGVIVLKND